MFDLLGGYLSISNVPISMYQYPMLKISFLFLIVNLSTIVGIKFVIHICQHSRMFILARKGKVEEFWRYMDKELIN